MTTQNKQLIIVHNIIAPYKVILFNSLYKNIPNLKVIFIAETENRRDWEIDYGKLNFPYEVLFKGQIDSIGKLAIAHKTWTTLNLLKPSSLVICDYSNIFGWASLFWGIRHKIKMVFWLDSTKDDRKHYFPKEQIKQLFLKHFDLFLAPGQKTQDYLEFMKVNSKQIVKTGYAVDNKFYLDKIMNLKDTQKKNNPKNTKRNFLFVGRLSKEKNIITLLKAFNNLRSVDNKWGLIIIGDGPQKEDLLIYIKNNNLGDRVYLPGFIQQNDIVKYYSMSDVFILPSKSEPWGLVVNEAMLCNLPVIVSSRCGSASELVKEGINGFTFNPDNQDTLEKLMLKFMSDEVDAKILGENSAQIVRDHSPENVASAIYDNFKKYNIL